MVAKMDRNGRPRWGVIDRKARYIVRAKNDTVFLREKYIYALNGKRLTIYNRDGQRQARLSLPVVGKNRDLNFATIMPDSANLAEVYYQKASDFGYIETVIIPFEASGKWCAKDRYQSICLLNNGLILFQKEDKWGLMNMAGKEINNGYDYINEITGTKKMAFLRKGKTGVMNTEGTELTYGFKNALSFSDTTKLSPATFDMVHWGVIDTNGHLIVPMSYYHVLCDQKILMQYSRKGSIYTFTNFNGDTLGSFQSHGITLDLFEKNSIIDAEHRTRYTFHNGKMTIKEY